MGPPSSRVVRLVFNTSCNITESAAGTGIFRFYRLNSVYDVDTSLGSTSTPGFLEWANFFNNYRVWKTRVVAKGFIDGSGTAAGNCAQVSLVPNSFQAVLPSSQISWPVQPQSLTSTVGLANYGGKNNVWLDKTFSIPSVMRITPTQYRNDMDFSATVSSNPTRQGFVALAVTSNASVPLSFNGFITVSMEIEFFNPLVFAT
jgi:hypothetical protein